MSNTFLTFFGSKLFTFETGGIKQWARIGNSKSILGDVKTVGLRWGAGSGHFRKIGDPWLRSLNIEFRKTSLWWNSWRTLDPGHFHFFITPKWWPW